MKVIIGTENSNKILKNRMKKRIGGDEKKRSIFIYRKEVAPLNLENVPDKA